MPGAELNEPKRTTTQLIDPRRPLYGVPCAFTSSQPIPSQRWNVWLHSPTRRSFACGFLLFGTVERKCFSKRRQQSIHKAAEASISSRLRQLSASLLLGCAVLYSPGSRKHARLASPLGVICD